MLKLIGLSNTLPAATAELSLAMNTARLGGQEQGMWTGEPSALMPSQLPLEGLVLGMTPKDGRRESIALELACRGWRGEPVASKVRESTVKNLVNCILIDDSKVWSGV